MFVLRVWEYEDLGVESGEDANWLRAEVDLAVGSYGTYRARQWVRLYAPDLAAFAGELRSLDRDRSGKAELRHLEDELAATVTLDAGKGLLAGYVREHIAAKLSFRDIATDETYVRASRKQFDALVAAFPPRRPAKGSC